MLKANPLRATPGVIFTTVSAVRGLSARVTAQNHNPPNFLAGDGAEVPLRESLGALPE